MSVESAVEDGQEEESEGGEAGEDGEEPELRVCIGWDQGEHSLSRWGFYGRLIYYLAGLAARVEA